MIVSLTYDKRRSWTARFCNTRPIKTLGDISMSFYMTHMLTYMLFAAIGTAIPGVTVGLGAPQMSGSGSGSHPHLILTQSSPNPHPILPVQTQ